jgi:transposase-like protein
VLEGLSGEDSIAELCRREGIVQNLYYRWSKDFLEAGKKSGWLAIRPELRRQTRSRTCVARPALTLDDIAAAARRMAGHPQARNDPRPRPC